jgi:D-cysteine desulfhydrase
MMPAFPKSLNLTLLNTPIVEVTPKEKTRLWLKRDDLTGIELSGNKIRKLDFLIQEAINEKAEGIITCGGLQSNHCRAAAYAAIKVGLDSILYLRGTPEEIPSGNHFLDLLSGSTIIYVSPEEYQNIDSIMEQRSRELKSEGKNYYVIPEGGSNEVGAWGYIKCFDEILDQMTQMKIPIEAIAVSTGSGGTHAGLYLGKLLRQSTVDVFSINVCDDAEFFKMKIFNIIKKFEQRYNHKLNVDKASIHIYDGFTGEGYGLISDREVMMIKEFIRKEGIVLDPVYTAKAYFGLEKIIEEGIIDYKNILFIHTGGIFGIFPQAREFF